MNFLDIRNHFVKLAQAVGNARKLDDIPHIYELLVPDRSARAGITFGLGGAAGAGLWNTLTPDEYDVNPLIPAALLSSLAAGGDVMYRHSTGWNDKQKNVYQFIKQVDLPAYLEQQGVKNPTYMDVAKAFVKIATDEGLDPNDLARIASSARRHVIDPAARKLEIPTFDKLPKEQQKEFWRFISGKSDDTPLVGASGQVYPRNSQ